jgi:hypothetical protein
MSYDKDINNHTVKFEDEKSYLNCRLDFLEYCKSCEDSYHGEGHADTLTFYGFIDSEMYYSNTCTVESIEPTQYTSEAPGVISNLMYFGSDGTATSSPVDNSSFIGFASGDTSSGDIPLGVPSSVVTHYGGYGTVAANAFGTGDVHISGDLIVDGNITMSNGYSGLAGSNQLTFTQHASEPPENPKEEPPENPIDSRFDILDL